jgi:hypothetical protein
MPVTSARICPGYSGAGKAGRQAGSQSVSQSVRLAGHTKTAKGLYWVLMLLLLDA